MASIFHQARLTPPLKAPTTQPAGHYDGHLVCPRHGIVVSIHASCLTSLTHHSAVSPCKGTTFPSLGKRFICFSFAPSIIHPISFSIVYEGSRPLDSTAITKNRAFDARLNPLNPSVMIRRKRVGYARRETCPCF